MPMYNIAGVNVFMEPRYNKTIRQSEKYRTSDVVKADIVIDYPESSIEALHIKAPEFPDDSCEYMSLGAVFYAKLFSFDGIMLHSSAVVYENNAYLFSAKSGTGKSTHTGLWLKYFGGDKAYILNDDKPAIRKIDGEYFACGTPFSGKVDLSRNEIVPLKAICVVKRGTENKIKLLDADEALFGLLNQTIRPSKSEYMEQVIDYFTELLQKVKVYELECDISFDAVKTAYEGMR